MHLRTPFHSQKKLIAFFTFLSRCGANSRELDTLKRTFKEDNNELRNQFHGIISLCFVPPEDGIQTFRLLQQSCSDELDEVATHLENTYILGRRRGRGRQRPRYPIES